MTGSVPAPEAAERTPSDHTLTALFGDRASIAAAYTQLLATRGLEWGLLGPRELPRLWTRHVLNCVALSPLLPERPGALVCDIGSGAGLPGLVLAIARPDLRFVLLEPLLRRAEFLLGVVRELGLEGVEVRRERAEEAHGRVHAEVVTARAVAPMDKLARWAMPLVGPGGALLALKGAAVDQELEAAARVLRQLGGASWDVVKVTPDDIVDATATVVRVVRSAHSARGAPESRDSASGSSGGRSARNRRRRTR